MTKGKGEFGFDPEVARDNLVRWLEERGEAGDVSASSDPWERAKCAARGHSGRHEATVTVEVAGQRRVSTELCTNRPCKAHAVSIALLELCERFIERNRAGFLLLEQATKIQRSLSRLPIAEFKLATAACVESRDRFWLHHHKAGNDPDPLLNFQKVADMLEEIEPTLNLATEVLKSHLRVPENRDLEIRKPGRHEQNLRARLWKHLQVAGFSQSEIYSLIPHDGGGSQRNRSEVVGKALKRPVELVFEPTQTAFGPDASDQK